MAKSNQKVVPEAKEALEKFKYEVASDIAVKKIFEIRQYHFATSYLVFISAPAQINHSIL